MDTVVVGIDVAKAGLDVHVLPVGEAFVVGRDAAGIDALIARLRPLAPAIVAVEATGGLESVVAAGLGAAGLPVVVVNPAQVKAFAQAPGKRAKTDPIDAAVIARFAIATQPAIRPLANAETTALADMLTRRRQIIQMIVAERQREKRASKRMAKSIQRLKKALQKELTDIDREIPHGSRDTVRGSPVWREKEDLLASVPGVGQAIARFDFRGKDAFRILVLMTGAFPLPLLALPLAVMFIRVGLETPSQGEVWIGGKRIDHLPPRERGISMVFQNYAVFPHLTVFENIGFGLRMAKMAQADVERRVKRTAELMHIEHLLERYSGQLSGGQRQRVAVARALAMEPDVILMDEPLSNLDALLRLEMRAELKGVLADSKTTTIYVTHDQVEAMSLADRISVMHQGKIIQADSPIEIYRNPAAHFVGSFIGNPPMNFLDAQGLGGGRWKVAGIEVDGPTNAPGTIQFAIRPKDLQPAETGLPAKVRVVEPLGPHVLLTCDVDGQSFRAVLDSDLQVSAGHTIMLTPLPDRIRWFDPGTTMAVAA